MKIIIVDTTIHGSLIGGGHLYLPGFMKGLKQQGHEVHLAVAGKPHERVAGFIADSGVTVHQYPWYEKGLVNDTAPQFAKWVNGMKPDVFLISASADIAWVALPLLDPSIVTVSIAHNDEETFYLPVRHYHQFLSGVVGVSPEICDTFIRNCHMDASRVKWIPYGVTTSDAAPVTEQKGSLRIIYAGRVVEEQKRISDVVAVIRGLSQQNTDYHFTLIGDGPEMAMVRTALHEEIASGKAELKGWLSNAEVINAFRSSELFLLTSAFEGFCIALIESMANGCCSLVTDIRSGNKALVEDLVSGQLIPVGDVPGFVQSLSQLANDRNRLAAWRKAAWEKGKQFSKERMVADYTAFFQTCSSLDKVTPRVPDAHFPLMSTCASRYPLWLRRIRFRLNKLIKN